MNSRRSDFGTEIRRMRQQARKTLKEVATFLGWSVPYVSDLEHNRRYPPAAPIVRQMAAFFGVAERADELVELAVMQRGDEISLKAQNNETRKLLVALERSIESQSLDPDQIEAINKILHDKEVDR